MQLLTWKQLASRVSVSVSTVKRLHAEDPSFPRKLTISSGRVGFDEAELDRWLVKLAEREKEMMALCREPVPQASGEAGSRITRLISVPPFLARSPS